jgi:nitrilase
MVSETSVERNLVQAGQLLEQAAAQGAELAVLPEYFCLMGLQDTDKLKVQEQFSAGPIQDFLRQSAPLATTETTRARNSSLVFDPRGQCVARYDKIHLFRFENEKESYDESCVLEPGAQPVTFELPSVDGQTYRIGMSICYDLRFPELYRRLKADILLVPSAFTFTTGQAHWEILLRARAIENLAFVLASAQGGVHENKRKTWGHSMVIGPWGQILAEQAQGAGVVVAEVLKETLQTARKRLPALDHAVL